ncbi:pyroglutamylated RF-amide peptide receptor-like [Oculina patagonica]
MSESAGVTITTVFFILVILNIVGNSFVCAIIKRNRDMRTPISYLLLNLAVADILYAMFEVPYVFFKLYFNHPDGVTGTVLCKLLTGGNIASVGITSSFVILAAIAIERYYAVMYPYGNKWKLTEDKLKVIIPGIWICSLILNIPQFLTKIFNKKTNSCEFMWPEDWMAKVYQTLKWNLVIALTLILMIVLYSRVVYTLWFKSDEANQLTHEQMGVLKLRKRVTLMIVAVSIIFGICWGVDQVVYTLKLTANFNVGPIPTAIANTMVLFNSAVNPFVYALLNKQFREKMKRMLCCIGSSTHRVHPAHEPQTMELANNQQPAGPHSSTTECLHEIMFSSKDGVK